MMDDLHLAAVAARVVAWHNRHPLARRIAASHVHAVGYVGLPFAGAAGAAAAAAAAMPPQAPAAPGDDAELVDLGAPEAGAGEACSLRERALARARQQAAADAGTAAPARVAPPAADATLPALATLQPDFSEDFIDPLNPRDVARFAARVGQVLARPPGDGPVREVPADGKHPGRQAARVYLLTAVVETGTRKSRVLLGTGLAAPVLGRRIFDAPRVVALAGVAGLVVGVPAWLLQPADAPAPSLQAAAPAVDLPASAALPASATDAGGAVAAASAPAVEPAAAPAPAASAAVETAAAAAVAPQATPASAAIGRVALPARAMPALPAGGTPAILPVLSDEEKARARQARNTLLAGRQAAAPAASAVPAAPPPIVPSAQAAPPEASAAPAPATALARTQAPAAPAAAAALPAPAAAAFALSTRPLRTRAEAEQVQVAMRSLLRTVGAVDVKVDVLPQGDDWRVVALPFPQRAAADKARTLLISRGMRVEVIDF